ncbi:MULTISPECIES: lanthionine synthetase LanC family protein [Streptomyces]|uniref:Lanthionine synthetase C family protein n=1 Tax=Streptomyces siderophoricus TaxID=2802281 RepID=A0ABS1MWN3_9ACTN|nr:lanthionine synthetase LanC family protein [Streptomyces sp. 9-7]MBL1092196.1 lanthionine synthetase C family protein [Streptomyces sp. 9-7]
MTVAAAMNAAVGEVEALAADALCWLLGSARETRGNGLAWADVPSAEETDPTLYSGTAGVIPVLLEARRHFGDDRYGDAALRAARSVSVAVDHWENNSLYFGLTGLALALRAVHDELGAPDAAATADRALDLVRARFDGMRWGDWFDLMGGNAGIGLGALAAGDPELAVLALEPYLRTAEQTPTGVHWEGETGRVSRFHHISHGTLGIVYGLACVGRATGRADLIELARAGAADVVARNEAGPAGFLVPHSDPQDHPELTARHSYGWCHGPSGDAHVFRLLRDALDDPAWQTLADRCWHTVTHSGLPRRLRPGFWDNNGRCCGTAGVLALACDRMAEQDDHPEFARLLVADLVARATRDTDGARWSNVEHRDAQSLLEPRTGWASGNAGIARELLRYVRMSRGADPTYVVAWPDQPVVNQAGAGKAKQAMSGGSSTRR